MTFPIPCVSDTSQTENLPENQGVCIGNGGEQRISVFFSNSQDVENQREKLGNKKAERGVRPAKRQKMVGHIFKNQEISLFL